MKKIIKISPYLFLGLSIGITFSTLIISYLTYQQRKKELKGKLITWKRIAQKHPEHPDTWAKLAIIWYNLKDKDLAKIAIKKARKLDPIREEIKNLEKEINF